MLKIIESIGYTTQTTQYLGIGEMEIKSYTEVFVDDVTDIS